MNMHYDQLTGLPSTSADTAGRHGARAESYGESSVPALISENAALRSELAAVQLDRSKLAETQRRIMELLNVETPDRLVHDVRNFLNERALLKALVDMAE